MDLYVEGYHGQRITKTSTGNVLVQCCLLESWFGYNRPITLKALSLRANFPEAKALRLMRKGVAKGRYIASPRGYLPSFGLAQAMAQYLQAARVPLDLTIGNFHIQTDVGYFKFLVSYLLTQQEHASSLGATANLLFLYLMRRELVHNLESTATDLSAALSLNKSTVSDTLRLLIERGHVVTTKDVTDDRRNLLWLKISDAHFKALSESFSSVFLKATASVESGGSEY
ncbi:MarR family transcriptional regulator [Pseudomonadales bacterium]|nr:MarR family transcriptional regulator [Pseudomonadales bacterium]